MFQFIQQTIQMNWTISNSRRINEIYTYETKSKPIDC